jgi:uncharacterized phiE125 gp8 family phage protein
MSQTLLVGPASEPISLSEAKDWLRIDGDDADDLVSTLIVSARLLVEQSARRLLITQSWRIYRDAWPPDGCVRLPIGPIANVAAIRVRDAAGEVSDVESASYALDAASDPARIIFTTMPPSPAVAGNGVEIDVTAGYGGAGAVPEPLRQAMRILIANWYENRGDAAFGGGDLALPPAAAALIAPWRRARLL